MFLLPRELLINEIDTNTLFLVKGEPVELFLTRPQIVQSNFLINQVLSNVSNTLIIVVVVHIFRDFPVLN